MKPGCLGRPLLLVPLLLFVLALVPSCSTKPADEEDSGGASTGATRPRPVPGETGTAGSTGSTAASSAVSLFESPRKADGEITVRIITNGISPFWDSMVAGMTRTAKELGCKANWAAPDPAQIVQQKRRIEEAVNAGADGISISAIEAAALKGTIDEVISEKKIPVITMDSDAPQSKRLVYIGTNNTEAGKSAGQEAIRIWPNGAKLVGFVGNLSAENARQRRDGFLEAIKGHQIELLNVFEDNKDKTRARKNVEDAITRYGSQVQGFLGLYSYNGPAIAQAVKSQNARDRYKIVCFDAEPLTQEYLEQGLIEATIVQKPYQFGAQSVRLLYLINRKGWAAAAAEMKIPPDGIVDTGVRVVTPQNIAEFRKELKALGVTSS